MAPVCTSSEINLLIYHYLKESGFTHSCFSLRHEGRLDDDPLAKQAIIEPGRLIRVLQKGLLYLAVEAHVNPDGTEKLCSAPFKLVGAPHVCDGRARSPPAEDLRPRSLTPEPVPSSSKRTLREAAAQTTPLELNAEASSSKDKLASTSAPSSVNGTAAGKRKDLDSPSPSDEASGRVEKRARRDHPKNDSLENGKGAGQEADTASETLKDKFGPAGATSREGTETPEPSSTAAALNKKKKKQLGGEKPAGKNPNRPQASSAVAPIKGKEPGLLRYPKQDEDGKHFDSSKVQFLFGHSGEVFVSAWNPTVPDLVASGAGDATVRIWDLNSGDPKKDDSAKTAFEAGEPLAEALVTKTVCKHLPSTHAKDVSALDWNPDGTLLASGSYDGILRLWTPQGDLHLVMSMHQGPIFSVRWNRKGTQLLTGSADSTAIVWDLSSGKVRQQYALHSDSVLDVDWLSAPKASTSKNVFRSDVPASTLAYQDAVFATCSADNSINLLKLGESKPLRTLKGHSDEVNAISFDNSRTLLASASDDMTAKIWALDSAKAGLGASAPRRSASPSASRKRNSPDYAAGPRKSGAMDVDAPSEDGRAAAGEDNDVDSLVQAKSSKGLKFTLAGHTRELYALVWCPSGPGTANESEPRMLATSAFDHTARLWNADDGSCLRVISNHSDSVYSLVFSPDAQYLVTGGIDALVLITKLNDGSIAKQFKASGAVLDVQWHSEASTSSKANGGPSPVKKEPADSDMPNGKRLPSERKARLSIAQQNKILTVLTLDHLGT